MDPLKKQIVTLLDNSEAHADFAAAVKNFPPAKRGVKPPGARHTAWQLLEHLRIAQWDILEFSRNPKHVSPPWPGGYWPPNEAPPDPASWDESAEAFERDASAFRKVIAEPASDLLAPLPHGQGQTLLREALLLADHNAYHIGQLVMLRVLLGVWNG
jgi:hypothetical protein